MSRVVFRWMLGFVLAGALSWHAPAYAQEATLLPNPGGGGFSLLEEGGPMCGWILSKGVEQWGSLDVLFFGERNFAQGQDQGTYDPQIVIMGLHPDYLPSQTLHCYVANAYVPGMFVVAPQGYSYDVNWNNSACDGYPPLLHGYHPSLTYSENADIPGYWPNMDAGIALGDSYWQDLAGELNYNGMTIGFGGEIEIAQDYLGTFEVANFNTGSRLLRLNNHFHSLFDYEQWAWVVSHELGHAHGFDHAGTSDPLKSIMVEETLGYRGTLARPVDKCAVVQAYPVDRRVQ